MVTLATSRSTAAAKHGGSYFSHASGRRTAGTTPFDANAPAAAAAAPPTPAHAIASPTAEVLLYYTHAASCSEPRCLCKP